MQNPSGSHQHCQPGEWHPHAAVWTAYPYCSDVWGPALEQAKSEFIAFCRVLVNQGGENLKLLVADEQVRREAEARLSGLRCEFVEIPYGDIWLRDTAPIFVKSTFGQVASVSFRFNGWGEKFVMQGDREVSTAVQRESSKAEFSSALIFEGGSIDVDGLGTALSTEECLLNCNRNPLLGKVDIEAELNRTLGISKIIWLEGGLQNDHTDGHVDNIARFVGPGRVICMVARSPEDPNVTTMQAIADRLERSTDAQGNSLQVIKAPSVGAMTGPDGEFIPASYLNFFIANKAVIVPIYGSRFDDEALSVISSCFPERQTIGVRANSVLSGGGSWHCITQQQPSEGILP